MFTYVCGCLDMSTVFHLLATRALVQYYTINYHQCKHVIVTTLLLIHQLSSIFVKITLLHSYDFSNSTELTKKLSSYKV